MDSKRVYWNIIWLGIFIRWHPDHKPYGTIDNIARLDMVTNIELMEWFE